MCLRLSTIVQADGAWPAKARFGQDSARNVHRDGQCAAVRSADDHIICLYNDHPDCSATTNTLGTALGNTRSNSMSPNNQTTIDMALSARIVSLCGAATGAQTKVATRRLGNLDDRRDSSKEIPSYIKSTCNNKTTMDMALSAATVDIYSASAEAKAAAQRLRNLEERFKPQSKVEHPVFDDNN
ncbi:hypothetical protein E4T43_07832 [Aureobasidium subglaciale]|nr:hypothetical protein E4T43_07832 [Aureobasidium subglaciale]